MEQTENPLEPFTITLSGRGRTEGEALHDLDRRLKSLYATRLKKIVKSRKRVIRYYTTKNGLIDVYYKTYLCFLPKQLN